MKIILFDVLLMTMAYVCKSASLETSSSSPKQQSQDFKKQVLPQVTNILDEVHNAIQTLKKSGKSGLRHDLLKAIELSKSINDKLMAFNPVTDIGKTVFKSMSIIFEETGHYFKSELKKLSPNDNYNNNNNNDDNKNHVIKQISNSIDDTRKTIDDYQKTDKISDLINGLKKTADFDRDIVKQLQDVDLTSDIGKKLLKDIEKLATICKISIENELKNIPPK
ncbi:probable autophagy-related protein 17 [Oppia nitens]|uniref:probable autophagy-related protein 17 n=1 Tax=Oppia nitens TaxID=1686743 RepID=UPI0023D9D09F|nr:probable autophagy-related protein 17 [Oppia nitens]